jgi:osmotically-inducible protein OsmY
MQGALLQNFKLVTVLVIVSLLTSCANVAVSGAQAVYNHKNLQNSINDQYIGLQANHILNHPRFKDTNISVATLNADVLLTGEAPLEWQKKQAGARISDIHGVRHVYNMVVIASPSSAITRVSDTWLTTKVKGKIIASIDIDATHIKVVTENSKVFLMGTLLPEEAEAAVDIASNTDGVTAVVKLFSYIKITRTLA